MRSGMGGTSTWRAALVTGAASGIGRSFAERLAADGAAVGVIDVAADKLEHAAEALRSGGRPVEARVADVGDAQALSAAVAELAAVLGGVDLAVHCGAILGPGYFADQPSDAFERVVRVDLLGTANLVRAVLPFVRASRGAIACLASTAAVHGWPGLGAYSAAKFGVAGFCDAVRGELARDGVALTSVFPLLIDTPLLSGPEIPPILRRGKRLPADVVVRKTLAGVRRRRPRVFVPGSVRVIAAAHGLFPSVLDWYGRLLGLPRAR